MEQNVKFAVDSIKHIQFSDYEDDEFAIAKVGFLSTRENSHKLSISEKVLRECAPTVLGKWIVVEMNLMGTDATTHTPNQHIVGQIPKEQEVEFVEDDEGNIRAYADAVISKIYAKDYCSMFETDNNRAVSVEMKIETAEGRATDDEVLSLKIVGVTTLGKAINPSCPESDIAFVRFAENEADAYFNKVHLTTLKKFAKERKANMEEKKTYKVDKSKEALSDKAWGEVDKTELRNKIMEASNRSTLVKSVYMLVEEGWEEAPSEHLKYPVMEFDGDTLVYNRDGLASALGYAKKENETAVVNKIEKIYKKLGLEETGKEGESKMAEIEFAAVDIGDIWGKVWDELHRKYPGPDGWGSMYCIDGIYEEDNQKFAIIRHRDEDALYRLNFSLTEEGMTLAEEITKVEVEIVETDEIRKFAEPEDVEKYKTFEDKPMDEEDEHDDDEEEEEEVKMSEDEMKSKIAELEASIEERDHIIMEKDAELEDLRAFKQSCMEADRAKKVEAIMGSVASFMDKDTAKAYREKGLACAFAEIDAWANEVKSAVFDKVTKQTSSTTSEFTRMSAPVETKKIGSVWDRLP